MNNRSNLSENSDVFKEATNNKKYRDGHHNTEKSYEVSRPYEKDEIANKNVSSLNIVLSSVRKIIKTDFNSLISEKDVFTAELHRSWFPDAKKDAFYKFISGKGCLPVNLLLEYVNQKGITLTSLITGNAETKEQPYDIDDVFVKIKEAFKTTAISDLDFLKTAKKYNEYDIQEMKQKLRLSIFLKLCFWMQLPQDETVAQDYRKYNYEHFIS